MWMTTRCFRAVRPGTGRRELTNLPLVLRSSSRTPVRRGRLVIGGRSVRRQTKSEHELRVFGQGDDRLV